MSQSSPDPQLTATSALDSNSADSLTTNATALNQSPNSLLSSVSDKRQALASLFALSLAACGGGGGSSAPGLSPSPAPGPAPSPIPAPPPAPPTRAEASRFLGLSSFGATDASVDDVVRLGYSGWVNEQLTLSQVLHMTHVDNWINNLNPDKQAWEYARNLQDSFYMQAVRGPDQLRQRMVFALSQIFVVSMASNEVIDRSSCHTSFMDMLGRNAFGNYRTLLEEVSTHGMMGVYLSHRANPKEDPLKGTSPDENYAREVMQLFTIGLLQLNADGTPKRDGSGNTIPTYDNADVAGLAKVFTGWSWVPRDTNSYRFNESFPPRDIQIQPMVPYEQHHSTSEKRFLGVSIPIGTTARPSLKTALDTLFNHPNTAPFVSRQLIQRFVTSNPSPAYVARVATAFANNGAGVRGDMKAIIRAILLDDEARLPARAGDGRHGKVREPVLRVTAWARAFNASSKSGDFRIRTTDQIGQTPMRAPSVFNFYRPGFVPPGSAIASAGLVAPELQINTESQITSYINFMKDLVEQGYGNFGDRDVFSSYSSEITLATNPEALIDRVDLLLSGGRLSPTTRSAMLTAIASVPTTATNAVLNRARIAILLALCSPEFLVQV
jgi:uncharacterized protein (DUF1800 family)